MDALTTRPDFKTPKEWPNLRKIFGDIGWLKTAETLLLAGDVGCVLFRHLEIHEEYKALFIRLFRVLGVAMRKVSTSGDRQILKEELPLVLATLEVKMPTSWCTMVMHLVAFHTVDTMERAGPFPSCNMLDIERYNAFNCLY